MAFILYKWLFVFLFPFSSQSPQASHKGMHPFYVSVAEIEQNAADKTLEISFKFFVDDFENTIKKAFTMSADISSEKDKAAFDKNIPVYINKYFRMTADGKPLTLNYVGFEKDKESVWCFFEVNNISAVKKLDVVNQLLYDFTDAQINIMHITINNKRQSTKLAHPDAKASFQW